MIHPTDPSKTYIKFTTNKLVEYLKNTHSFNDIFILDNIDKELYLDDIMKAIMEYRTHISQFMTLIVNFGIYDESNFVIRSLILKEPKYALIIFKNHMSHNMKDYLIKKYPIMSYIHGLSSYMSVYQVSDMFDKYPDQIIKSLYKVKDANNALFALLFPRKEYIRKYYDLILDYDPYLGLFNDSEVLQIISGNPTKFLSKVILNVYDKKFIIKIIKDNFDKINFTPRIIHKLFNENLKFTFFERLMIKRLIKKNLKLTQHNKNMK